MIRAWLTIVLLATAWAGLSHAQDLGFSVSPPSGTYDQDVTLTVQSKMAQKLSFRFTEGGTEDFLPLEGRLVLKALEGEKRSYSLKIRQETAAGEALILDYRYVIDKRRLLAPQFSLNPGVYEQNQSLRLNAASGRVFFRWDQEAFKEYFGQSLPLNVDAGRKKEFRLEAYCRDETGKESPVRAASFTIDRSRLPKPDLSVESPVAGTFANQQLLVLHGRDLESLRYSTDGSDPAASGRVYEAPVLLPAGNLTVKVWAKVRGQDATIRREIALSSGTEPLPEGLPASGLLRTDLSLVPVKGWFLARGESLPSEPWSAAVALPLLKQGRKISVLRLAKEGTSAVFRMVYVQDDRIPSSPVYEISPGFRPEIRLSGHPEGRILFTLDGSAPTGGSAAFGTSLLLEDLTAQKVEKIQAVTAFPNGRLSPPAVLDLAALQTRLLYPQPKALKAEGRDEVYGFQFSVAEGMSLVYEMDTEKGRTAFPQAVSAESGTQLIPDLPFGMERTFYFRFAFKDSQGQLGPSTAEIPLHIDRIPPVLPTIARTGAFVKFQTEDSVYYLLSATPAEDLDPQKFQKYDQSVALPSGPKGEVKTIYLHYFAVDKAGNSSKIRVNEPILLDGREPGIAGLRGFVQNAVTNREVLRIEPLVSGDHTEIRYSYTLDGSAPPDPKVSGAVYKEPLLLEGLPGTQRTIRTAWNLLRGDKWLLSPAAEFQLVQDLIPPQKPVFVNLFPSKTVNQDWSIEAEPREAGDRITYTLTQDRENPDSPLGPQGLPWTGKVLLSVPEDQKASFHLRIGISDPAGNSLEILGIKPISVDKRKPQAPELEDYPPVYRSREPLSLRFKSQSDRIHYALSEGASLPDLPNAASPAFEGPLSLPGRKGQAVLYRLRAVAVNDLGNRSAYSPLYSLVVDLREGADAEGAVRRAEAAVSLVEPLLTGFPEGNLSSKELRILNLTPQGKVRYELASGTETLASVSAFSPLMPGELVITPAGQEQRPYILSVRNFHEETGQPLSEEKILRFTLDTLPPRAPEIRVVPAKDEASARITFAGEGTIFYRWEDRSFPVPMDYQRFEGAVVLRPARGILPGFRLQAYCVDPAGNQGPVSEQTLFLDQEAVYLAPGGSGNGTKSAPFGSLEKAFEEAQRTGRKLFLVRTGDFPLTRTLDLTGLHIAAGLGPDWDPWNAAGTTTVKAQADFQGVWMLRAGEGTLGLSRLEFQQGSAPLIGLLETREAQASLSRIGFKGGISDDWTGLRMTGGTVYAEKLSVTSSQAKQSTLVLMENLKAQLTELTLSGQDSAVLDAGLILHSCDVKIQSLVLKMGLRSELSTGLSLNDSFLELGQIQGEWQAQRGNAAFQLSDSTLDLGGGKLLLKGSREFNRLCAAENSLVKAKDLTVIVEAADYVTGWTMTRSSLEASRMAGDWSARLSVRLFHLLEENKIELKGGRQSLLAPESAAASILFALPSGKNQQILLENPQFAGWKTEVLRGAQNLKLSELR